MVYSNGTDTAETDTLNRWAADAMSEFFKTVEYGSEMEDHIKFIRDKRSTVILTKSWLPRQCAYSGVNIHGKRAYRVKNVLRGVYDSHITVKWYEYDTYLKLVLMA